MEKLYEEGVLKAIGISNFSVKVIMISVSKLNVGLLEYFEQPYPCTYTQVSKKYLLFTDGQQSLWYNSVQFLTCSIANHFCSLPLSFYY